MPARALTLAAALAALAAWPAAGQERPRQVFDLYAEERPLPDVVDEIARRSGRNIVVEAGVDDPVTIDLRQVSWRQALELVAERTDCDVKRLGGGVLILTRPPRMHVRLVDADVQTALLMLAEYGEKSIVIAPDVRGTVSLELRNVEWAAAIRVVAAQAGDFVVTGGGDALVTVGAGRGAAPTTDEPVVSGRVVTTAEGRLVIELGGGERLELSLPRDAARRALARETLGRLRPGDRIVCTFRAEGSELILESAITPGRRGGPRPAEPAAPR